MRPGLVLRANKTLSFGKLQQVTVYDRDNRTMIAGRRRAIHRPPVRIRTPRL
jgi:hypothetical protein